MATDMSIVERTRLFLTNRKAAYCRVFDTADNDAVAVLRDLAKFCRAHESTAHVDPQMAARLDGRREVWLRLQQHIQLDDETLWRLYGGPTPKG